MFDTLKRLYNTGKVTKAMLKVAVTKKWLTVDTTTNIDEYKDITEETYSV